MFRSSIAFVTAVVTALAAGATSLLGTAAQAQERDLKFVLDFISLGRHAPWYVVPADDKENCRLIVSQIVLDAFRELKTRYPEPDKQRVEELKAIRKKLVNEKGK